MQTRAQLGLGGVLDVFDGIDEGWRTVSLFSPLEFRFGLLAFFGGIELPIVLFDILMGNNVEEELGSEPVDVGEKTVFRLFYLYPVVVVEGWLFIVSYAHILYYISK